MIVLNVLIQHILDAQNVMILQIIKEFLHLKQVIVIGAHVYKVIKIMEQMNNVQPSLVTIHARYIFIYFFCH